MLHNQPISAADFFPKRRPTLTSLRKASLNCEGCPLYKNATQTVFGEGSKNARLIITGEIPGNHEDQAGRPFVGPAGLLLRETLEKYDLDIEDIYFTNVVKHFKFIKIHNRKLHRSPIGSEIRACKPWLEAEINIINPEIILCLGVIAAKALIEKNFKIGQQRGKLFSGIHGSQLIATLHPSAILRAPEKKERHRLKDLFEKDIRKIARLLISEH